MIILFKIPLICSFCPAVVGAAAVSSEYGWTEETATQTEYDKSHGILEHRCNSCQDSHGTFRELVDAYLSSSPGKDWKDAEEFVSTYPKRADFDKALKMGDTIRVDI